MIKEDLHLLWWFKTVLAVNQFELLPVHSTIICKRKMSWDFPEDDLSVGAEFLHVMEEKENIANMFRKIPDHPFMKNHVKRKYNEF